MTVFADSTAMVKLYVDEDGSDQIRNLEALAVSQIARVEIPAALWRKQRLGEVSPYDAQILTAEFEADFFGSDSESARFLAIAVTPDILEVAAHLCAAHGLRAYDAVQLATAVAARQADRSCTTLAAFDTALRLAAAIEGFALLPV